MRIICPLLFILAFVAYSESKCCGRGQHGFCKDCSVVGLLKARKCCGSGSGSGKGCNVFCCNCGGGSCLAGSGVIRSGSGWWLSKKYTCTLGDAEVTDNSQEAKSVFDAMDADKDYLLNLDEFAEGMRQHLNLDFDSSSSFAADLLHDSEMENVIPLMDAAQSTEDMDEDTEADIAAIIRREFMKMDANGDGIIQAKEFDRDL